MWVIYNASTGWELDSIEDYDEALVEKHALQDESFDSIAMRWEVR